MLKGNNLEEYGRTIGAAQPSHIEQTLREITERYMITSHTTASAIKIK